MCSMGGEEKSSYCYSDVASSSGGNLVLHHSFDPNPEIYNLTAGMEMIGFPSKTSPHHLYQNEGEELMMVSQDSSPTWTHPHHNHNRSLLVDDQSLRCVFPCDDEQNQRPTQHQTQALSLSLNSSNPSSIGLHTFDLRKQQEEESDDLRIFGPSSSRSVNVPHLIQEHSFIRNSKYLSPAQELLNEFCNLGTKLQNDDSNKHKVHNHKMGAGQDNETVDKKQSHLCSLDFLELQIRKTKLLQMLEEVDRRYKHYCDQMKAVLSSFEAVAGNGAALVYSNLASKAMSRHFRCLKDGIVTQIKATKKAMGEKDVGAASGTMRGETPRLRVIDQTMRQQRALQQMSMMESHPWRPQRGLPERSVSVLRAWLFEHFLHPYPSDVDKHILARQTGLSRSQVSNWFINARVRLWKPMVEDMYLEEVKESEGGMGGRAENHDFDVDDDVQNPCRNLQDQKPSQEQLIRIDSDCLSSIITNPDTTSRKDKSIVGIHNPNFARLGDSMELDFSSYNPHSGAVSLTLGLHQHGGPSLGFSPAAVGQNNNASSFFYPRTENMGECQTASYSLLESETQNLPAYRNLMGAQMLHDLAG